MDSPPVVAVAAGQSGLFAERAWPDKYSKFTGADGGSYRPLAAVRGLTRWCRAHMSLITVNGSQECWDKRFSTRRCVCVAWQRAELV